MKKLIVVLILILITPNLNISAKGTFQDLPMNESVQEITDEIPEETKKIMQRFGIDDISPESLLSLSFTDFLSFCFENVKTKAVLPLKHIFLVIAVTVMCALLENFKSSFSSESLNKIFGIVSTLAVVLIIGDGVIGCIHDTCLNIEGYNNFMLGFIPVYAGSITVAGAPITSGIYGTFMFFTCQIIATVITSTIMPLLNVYLGISIISGVNPDLKLNGICDGIKKTAIWMLMLLMTLFTGIMSIQTVISTGSDNLAVKTGKYLIGSFVPVVGSALSEVLLSIQGSVKLLKNCIGGYCVAAVAVTFIPVLITLVMWKFSVFVSQIFSEILNVKSVASVTKSIGGTFSVLIAIVLVFVLLIIISTTLMMLLGQGTF